MELRTIVEAIGRFKYVAIVGTVGAIVLSFLAFAKIDTAKFPPFERRVPPDYQSTVRLFVTQPGFPWGRSALKYTSEDGGPPVLEGDPDRFATLAVLYANIANSGTILNRVQVDGEKLRDLEGARVSATVVPASQFSAAPLPLVDIAATYKTKEGAVQLARRTTDSLIGFVTAGQKSSRIPEDERVSLQVIDAGRPRIVGGGSVTLPVLVFLTIITLTLTIIFVLRNLSRSGAEVQSVGAAGPGAPLMQPNVVESQPKVVAAPVATAREEAASAPSGRRVRPPVADRLGDVGWTEARAAGEER